MSKKAPKYRNWILLTILSLTIGGVVGGYMGTGLFSAGQRTIDIPIKLSKSLNLNVEGKTITYSSISGLIYVDRQPLVKGSTVSGISLKQQLSDRALISYLVGTKFVTTLPGIPGPELREVQVTGPNEVTIDVHGVWDDGNSGTLDVTNGKTRTLQVRINSKGGYNGYFFMPSWCSYSGVYSTRDSLPGNICPENGRRTINSYVITGVPKGTHSWEVYEIYYGSRIGQKLTGTVTLTDVASDTQNPVITEFLVDQRTETVLFRVKATDDGIISSVRIDVATGGDVNLICSNCGTRSDGDVWIFEGVQYGLINSDVQAVVTDGAGHITKSSIKSITIPDLPQITFTPSPPTPKETMVPKETIAPEGSTCIEGEQTSLDDTIAYCKEGKISKVRCPHGINEDDEGRLTCISTDKSVPDFGMFLIGSIIPFGLGAGIMKQKEWW